MKTRGAAGMLNLGNLNPRVIILSDYKVYYCKLHDPNCSRFVTIHSRHRQTDDRRHIMTIAELAIQLQHSARNSTKATKTELVNKCDSIKLTN